MAMEWPPPPPLIGKIHIFKASKSWLWEYIWLVFPSLESKQNLHKRGEIHHVLYVEERKSQLHTSSLRVPFQILHEICEIGSLGLVRWTIMLWLISLINFHACALTNRVTSYGKVYGFLWFGASRNIGTKLFLIKQRLMLRKSFP